MTNIFKIILIYFALLFSINAYSKSNNTKMDYLDIESKYYMGEYTECSNVGDSIYYVENIYDAMILSCSALANHNIAFADRVVDHNDNTYGANFHRARIKAQDALEYIISDLNSSKGKKISDKILPEKLQLYTLAILCSRILQIPQYKQVVKYIKDNIIPIRENLGKKFCVEKLQIIYFEIIYALDHDQEDYVYKELLPLFENEVCSLQSIDPVQKSRIANIYVQLSDYFNYKLMDTEAATPQLKDMAINTMIHSRDYALFSKKANRLAVFIKNDWKQLKSKLTNDEAVLLYFSYARSTDSWNYIWIIKPGAEEPSLAYGGHSYWSENKELSLVHELDMLKTIYVVGTNGMKFTDFYTDSRIVRIHSFSELSNLKKKYNGGKVTAIGNINYSIDKNSELSTEKGVLRKLGNFASAEREMESLRNIFGDKIEIFQGNNVSRKLLHTLNTKISILHLSTHGMFSKQLLYQYNRDNANLGVTGDNIFKSCGLMLSGYNDNKEENFISAYDIKNMDLRDIDFVFISACESGAGQVLTIGDYSLAEAFHIAGVKNIIAVVDPIKEDIATNFAEMLYKQIINGKTYHDAFHEAKNKICPTDRIFLFE